MELILRFHLGLTPRPRPASSRRALSSIACLTGIDVVREHVVVRLETISTFIHAYSARRSSCPSRYGRGGLAEHVSVPEENLLSLLAALPGPRGRRRGRDRSRAACTCVVGNPHSLALNIFFLPFRPTYFRKSRHRCSAVAPTRGCAASGSLVSARRRRRRRQGPPVVFMSAVVAQPVDDRACRDVAAEHVAQRPTGTLVAMVERFSVAPVDQLEQQVGFSFPMSRVAGLVDYQQAACSWELLLR